MDINNLSKKRQMDLALSLNKSAAELGKDSTFKHWWFFDTNCLSELVKLSSSGHKTNVSNFISGKDVLITSTSIQELSKAPDILLNILSSLETANLYFVPDITKFWYTDFINFFDDNKNHVPMNSLDAYPLKPDLIDMVLNTRNDEFEGAINIFEENVLDIFFDRVTPDIGASLDERDLCVHIFKVINEYSQTWFNISIPHADISSLNFPSFYTFFYAYYFRIVKNRDIKLESNDFIDLENCMISPYCESYYCEATFANVLNNIKGRKPPTAYQIVKKMYKMDLITNDVFNAQRRNKEKLSTTCGLLMDTEILKFADMRSQIL